jgi:fluoroquinolone transport system permease protein
MTARSILAFGLNDSRLILRDSFLRMMVAMIVLIALGLRFGLPPLTGYLDGLGLLPGALATEPASHYFPLALAYFSLFDGPLLVGFIFGFVVLDEKEDRTLDAMAVTPVALVDYMLWRSLLSWTLGFGVTLAQMLFIGPALEQPGMDTAALPSLIPLIGLCALAGMGAPLFMLFLAATASDKVQGFAMAKFIGIGGLLILVGWFLPSPLDWLPALFPPYLVAKAYWLSLSTGVGSGIGGDAGASSLSLWLSAVAALFLHIVAIAGLIAHLDRRQRA